MGTTSDIFDWRGVKIGTLELPTETTEEQWAEKLATYAQAPSDPTVAYIETTIEQRKAFADQLMEDIKRQNTLEGINLMQALWVHHRLRALEITIGGVPFTIDLMNLVISGDIEVAAVVLMNTTPDDMTQPYHWLSTERLSWITAKITTYLGW